MPYVAAARTSTRHDPISIPEPPHARSPKPRRLDQPIAVSLEDLDPPSNFYRHLEAKLELGFVRVWTRELYADRGRPSIDPVVFFKLLLIMLFTCSSRVSAPSASRS